MGKRLIQILIQNKLYSCIVGVVIASVATALTATALHYRHTSTGGGTVAGSSSQPGASSENPATQPKKTGAPRASSGKAPASAATKSANGTSSGGGSTSGATGAANSSGGSSVTTARDPLKQPFASTSIWNMPIGSGAQYAFAGLGTAPSGTDWMPKIDDDRIILKPNAPLTKIVYNSAGWSGADRCDTSGAQILGTVPIPAGYTVPNSKQNNAVAILEADGRTIDQTQAFARCTAGAPAAALNPIKKVDLYGAGISGSHGGSGLSAIGGTIRLGELRPGQQGIQHVLKMNVYTDEVMYECQVKSDCFRWPAAHADGAAVGKYGTLTNNQNTAMKMGALLAIPHSTNINSLGLESDPGRQIAWTLQNYGAYIVDGTGHTGIALETEDGPDGSLRTQFAADYGYPLQQNASDNTAWSRDMQRIIKALYVVNNNSAASIGGGGTPLQPLAAPINP